MNRKINHLVAAAGTPQLTNHAKTSAGCGLAGGRAYSLAALTKAIRGASAAPLGVAGAPARLAVRLSAPRARAALFDRTKSETRGTISARNREPLNTP